MSNRIHAKGTFVHEEYKANSALIYPGFLIMLDSNGEVTPHDIDGGPAEAMFAEEDALQGADRDTIYDDDSIVSCILPNKGSCVYAMIADDEDIAIGDPLMSGGDGTLVEAASVGSASANDENVIAYAMEAKDLTNSAVANGLALVRIV